jgi:hypothetical protein
MKRRIVRLMIPGVALVLAGCAARSTAMADERGDGVQFEHGAVILTGRSLTDGPGTVLAAMSGKVPNLKVRRQIGQCPQLILRGHSSFVEGIENPHVYVDGTRSTDTCILETLRTDDVVRVEVYPQGYTTRPGYAPHSAGLILVFMRGG